MISALLVETDITAKMLLNYSFYFCSIVYSRDGKIPRFALLASCFICIFIASYRWLCIEMRIVSASVMEMHIPRVQQWWSVTKYNYFVTVLKYIFQVSVLYWSSFILSNFYFYFTTFQSIRSYFLLHYIS